MSTFWWLIDPEHFEYKLSRACMCFQSICFWAGMFQSDWTICFKMLGSLVDGPWAIMFACWAVCCLYSTSLPLLSPKPYQEFDLRGFNVKSIHQPEAQYSVQYRTVAQLARVLRSLGALRRWKKKQIEWTNKWKERGTDSVCVDVPSFHGWGVEGMSESPLSVACCPGNKVGSPMGWLCVLADQ